MSQPANYVSMGSLDGTGSPFVPALVPPLEAPSSPAQPWPSPCCLPSPGSEHQHGSYMVILSLSSFRPSTLPFLLQGFAVSL